MLDLFVHNRIAGLLQLILLLSVCITIEHISPIERYSLRARLPGVAMHFAGAGVGIVLSYPVHLLWRSIDVPFISLPLGTAAQIVVLLLIGDFLSYWRHRAEHRWFWPIHAVHHAPTELHAANDLGHPLQFIPQFLFVSIPLSFLGVQNVAVPFAAGMIFSFLEVYIHSPIDVHFGPLRRIVVDNRFHRLHHSLESQHIDTNFGICFSVWDAIFGTAVWPKKDEWPLVGVAGLPAPRSVRDFLLLPLRIARKDYAGPGIESSNSQLPVPAIE